MAATQVIGSLYIDRCNSQTFSSLDVFGAKILNVDATPRQVSTSVDTTPSGYTSAGTWQDLNICNITVTYTHPGRNDEININAWLPLEDWNGRFLASGGGGWLTGSPAAHHAPIAAQGFATASTDGGHSVYDPSSAAWALNSPGNVDLNMLQNFGSVALNDLAIIGKQVTELLYDQPADYSYWAGCSTGGRQGIMLAQRYPEVFDGILALAPAINWVRFVVAEYWPQHVMNRLEYYPTPEELNAITSAAIEACDEVDGVKDGIISLPGECNFDALALVGNTYLDREGQQQHFTTEAATIANAAWRGPRSPNSKAYDWHGLNHDAPLTTGLIKTTCQNASTTSCSPSPFPIASEWIKFFLAKDPHFDLTSLTNEEYFELSHQSIQEYESIIGTSDPDLSAFRRSGGKMLTWHGLADPLIFPNGSSEYYRKVLDMDGDAGEYYRYFEAPGVGHCSGGRGPFPNDALRALMEWVESGVVPETLTARIQQRRDEGGKVVERRLCAWPKVQKYVGGSSNVAESFECV